jgi:hypothetical protein
VPSPPNAVDFFASNFGEIIVSNPPFSIEKAHGSIKLIKILKRSTAYLPQYGENKKGDGVVVEM